MGKAYDGRPRFNRWGKHYLRALMRAHQLQMCTNFKDPGLQVYGGPRFKDLRSEGDQVFVSVPMAPPSSAAAVSRPSVASRPSAAASPPSNVGAATYYNSGGG